MYKTKWQNGYVDTLTSAITYVYVQEGPVKIVESSAMFQLLLKLEDWRVWHWSANYYKTDEPFIFYG
jgi:hypothetical protein